MILNFKGHASKRSNFQICEQHKNILRIRKKNDVNILNIKTLDYICALLTKSLQNEKNYTITCFCCC